MSTNTSTFAADPVLAALATKHPELDAIRWRVRLPDSGYTNIVGEKVDTSDTRRLLFALDDGTQRTFERGEWVSCIGMPGPVGPVLDDIIHRLHLFGLADTADYLNQGAWLQAQPEWIAYEREHATPAELADAERIHALRRMGF